MTFSKASQAAVWGMPGAVSGVGRAALRGEAQSRPVRTGGRCELGVGGGEKALPGAIPVVWRQQQDKKWPFIEREPCREETSVPFWVVWRWSACETLKRRRQVGPDAVETLGSGSFVHGL